MKIHVVFSLLPISLSSQLIFQDKTIRPFGDSNDQNGFCIYKRYADYIKSQEVWMWPCADSYHVNPKKSGKYHWSFDNSTGLIRSEGSFAMRPNKPFCWWVSRPETMYSQRLKIKACDENDVQQQFSLVDGRIHSNANLKLCVGHETGENGEVASVALTLSKCYGQARFRLPVLTVLPVL